METLHFLWLRKSIDEAGEHIVAAWDCAREKDAGRRIAALAGSFHASFDVMQSLVGIPTVAMQFDWLDGCCDDITLNSRSATAIFAQSAAGSVFIFVFDGDVAVAATAPHISSLLDRMANVLGAVFCGAPTTLSPPAARALGCILEMPLGGRDGIDSLAASNSSIDVSSSSPRTFLHPDPRAALDIALTMLEAALKQLDATEKSAAVVMASALYFDTTEIVAHHATGTLEHHRALTAAIAVYLDFSAAAAAASAAVSLAHKQAAVDAVSTTPDSTTLTSASSTTPSAAFDAGPVWLYLDSEGRITHPTLALQSRGLLSVPGIVQPDLSVGRGSASSLLSVPSTARPDAAFATSAVSGRSSHDVTTACEAINAANGSAPVSHLRNTLGGATANGGGERAHGADSFGNTAVALQGNEIQQQNVGTNRGELMHRLLGIAAQLSHFSWSGCRILRSLRTHFSCGPAWILAVRVSTQRLTCSQLDPLSLPHWSRC